MGLRMGFLLRLVLAGSVCGARAVGAQQAVGPAAVTVRVDLNKVPGRTSLSTTGLVMTRRTTRRPRTGGSCLVSCMT